MDAHDQQSQSQQRRIALISVHGDPAIEIGKEEAGGQNVYVRHVGEALAKQGWQVDMFTRQVHPEDPTLIEHAPNCRTHRFQAGPQEFIPRDDLFEYLPEFVDKVQAFQQTQGYQYRIVHTNYWLSSWVGMELKKRQPLIQVHTYHSLGVVKYNSVPNIPPIGETRLAVEKTLLETAERVVATSPQEKEHMRSLVSPKGTIDIIPAGTDIERFGSIDRATARQQLGVGPETKVVFYVGRFDPRKGIETLVRAMAQSTLRGQADLKLIIGGGSRPGQSDGNERDRIEALVKELGIDDFTEFPGRISDDDLPAYYAAADVSVLPSHYEPFGLVTIEAMACGTPVVASDVGGFQFTVASEQTGLLVPPKDDAGFAQAIDRILADPDWQKQLGQEARRRVEAKFSWNGVASQLADLYTRLLAETQAGEARIPQELGM